MQADGEDEDINIVDDGSKLDDRARRFDVIVGALEGKCRTMVCSLASR